MRRKEQEVISISAIENIINESLLCRVAFTVDNKPYVLPFNFGYQDKTIFIHSAREGKKLDMIKKNNEVSFEMDVYGPLKKASLACEWGITYKSVVGFGKALIVDEPQEKSKALDIIMAHYSEKKEFTYPAESIARIVIIKIVIDEMTGKQSL